ncbi:spore germination protein [Fictibacillus sp. WQ 8-8]|uniref:GerAB/ArcD/ProY family transporter n=1 Tax=Fictibacillus sp. WQ 8-8 TaxID=2938788 RepID=UPI0021087CBE|nr:GerAB/ArcD/ProY family transporter [Fictibacillus sp. WQ 8-8]MCQ6264806.1 spore germination protein [Fictibacillus sp. WQ 8-8]
MEKARITPYQLFVLILLFELGSALLVAVGIEAKQDAWIVILLGMLGGLGLFFICYRLYCFYPDMLPTEYLQKVVGKGIGRPIAYLYMLYNLYIAGRVLRDFGTMLLTFAYFETPLLIANTLMILVIIYTVSKGIEVLARTGELFLVFIYLLAGSGVILVLFSGVIDIHNLQPVLENGWKPIIKTTLKESLYFPFGELLVFTMIIPYVEDAKKLRNASVLATVVSGLSLALVMMFNISILGVNLTALSQFPLLSTIQTIQVADFLERLDVYFMIALVVGGFFKISLFLYVAVIGTANLFNVKPASRLSYPLGLVVLFMSMTMASNYSEHIKEGIGIIPLLLHLPFQYIFPIIVFIVAYFKNKNKSKNQKAN